MSWCSPLIHILSTPCLSASFASAVCILTRKYAHKRTHTIGQDKLSSSNVVVFFLVVCLYALCNEYCIPPVIEPRKVWSWTCIINMGSWQFLGVSNILLSYIGGTCPRVPPWYFCACIQLPAWVQYHHPAVKLTMYTSQLRVVHSSQVLLCSLCVIQLQFLINEQNVLWPIKSILLTFPNEFFGGFLQ